jgi:hypothetical protein
MNMERLAEIGVFIEVDERKLNVSIDEKVRVVAITKKGEGNSPRPNHA